MSNARQFMAARTAAWAKSGGGIYDLIPVEYHSFYNKSFIEIEGFVPPEGCGIETVASNPANTRAVYALTTCENYQSSPAGYSISLSVARYINIFTGIGLEYDPSNRSNIRTEINYPRKIFVDHSLGVMTVDDFLTSNFVPQFNPNYVKFLRVGNSPDYDSGSTAFCNIERCLIYSANDIVIGLYPFRDKSGKCFLVDSVTGTIYGPQNGDVRPGPDR